MSETVNKVWLKDENEIKLAPKTFISQVLDEEGKRLSDYIDNTLITTEDEAVEIPDGLDSFILQSSLGDAYDNTKTYAMGDYVIYRDVLYKCTTAIEAAEAWDETKWTATTINAEFSEINSNLNTYEEIPLEDFFKSTNVEFTSGTIYRKGNHIFISLQSTGSITMGSNGKFILGLVNDAYKPKCIQIRGSYYNSDTSGEVWTPCSVYMSTSSNFGIITGLVSEEIGNSTHPWCTKDGIFFDYEL